MSISDWSSDVCSSDLDAVAKASGATLADVAKLNIFLTDLAHFATVNEIMAQYFQAPFPARAAIGVAPLPTGARVEADAIIVTEQFRARAADAWWSAAAPDTTYRKSGRGSGRERGGHTV